MANAITQIDAANVGDTNRAELNGESRPAELIYGGRMSAALDVLQPQASEEVQIAARAQHIRRWMIPRAGHLEYQTGNRAWRKYLNVDGFSAGIEAPKCDCCWSDHKCKSPPIAIR